MEDNLKQVEQSLIEIKQEVGELLNHLAKVADGELSQSDIHEILVCCGGILNSRERGFLALGREQLKRKEAAK